jgi:DNA-binding PadR family transcriptional regulator
MNVHFALLALLADGPRSGLWLREELAADPSSTLPLNASQVYPALARLELAGLVESGGAGADDPQQEFRITAGGQRELTGWLHTTLAPGAQPGDELILKIQLAGQVPGTDVHEVIQAHRRHLVELMQRRTGARPDGAGQNLGRALASYAELFRLDSVIRWLDAAEQLLGPGPPPAAPPAVQQLTRSGPRTATGNGPWPGSATTSPRAGSPRGAGRTTHHSAERPDGRRPAAPDDRSALTPAGVAVVDRRGPAGVR